VRQRRVFEQAVQLAPRLGHARHVGDVDDSLRNHSAKWSPNHSESAALRSVHVCSPFQA
jgi:hypothetical protein